MSFLTGNINFKAYIDSAQTEFPEQLISDMSKDFEDTAMTEAQTTSFVLAASATQAITFNSVATVKRWYLFSSAAALTLTINGTAGFTYESGMPGYVPIQLSSLSITNTSSTDATTVTLIMIAG